MTSATRRYFAGRRMQRGLHLRREQATGVRENFGIDKMYVGPVIARGFSFRKNHCRTYVMPWKRTFRNTASLKKHLATTAGRFVVESVVPADCDR